MHPVPIPEILLLTGAAFCAGAIDAIAGGGGLITIPALLAVGLPPHYALGTNKGQALFGSLAAWIRYAHSGLVDRRSARITFPMGFAGSLGGAALVLVIRPDVLRPLVLLLLIAAAIVLTVLRPAPGAGVEGLRRHAGPIAAAIALVIGAYDGFFGPGTGTFLIAAFVGLLGMSLTRASADAKVVNFASNVAAAAVFATGGVIIWAIAIPMACAQLLGGFLGAHIAVRRGVGLIRAVVLLVVLALVIKVGRDLYLGR
ncbi:MAG: TSUP family transporter [Candidatus Latescibacteria bacterium]|nr:TSUP family transporter [Candidatus Latescibacterota bacterium]